MYSNKMWQNVKQALKLIGMAEPNCLFVGADNVEYLLFAEIDYEDIEPIEKQLRELGVEYVGKFECLGIDTDTMWDGREKV